MTQTEVPLIQPLASVLEPPSPLYVPPYGARLEPGDYLIELAFARPAPAAAVVAAMGAIGFDRVVLDESLREDEPTVFAEWADGQREIGRLFLADPPHLVRFFGRLTRPILCVEGPEVAWLYARPAAVDVYAEISEAEPLVPHELHTGKTYEIRLVSRMRAQRTRASVVQALTELMGFELVKLSALKRDMRLPGKPGASAMLWYGIVRWPGPQSYVTIEDPFYFQDVKETAT